MHPPKTTKKPTFVVTVNAWIWVPVQTVLYELEM